MHSNTSLNKRYKSTFQLFIADDFVFRRYLFELV